MIIKKYLKRINKILSSISIAFIVALLFSLLSMTCSSDNDKETNKTNEHSRYEQDEDTTFENLDTSTNKSNDPEYVPPKDGRSNKYWNGNKHRRLLKDRDCYFKNGLRKRKRDGTGNPDGKRLHKRYGQQRQRRGQR